MKGFEPFLTWFCVVKKPATLLLQAFAFKNNPRYYNR